MRISVCMATHNGEKYLSDQINSIISQLETDDELIISDDGSTDGTLAIVNHYVDPRITLIHSAYPNDPIRNFENALLKSSGHIIFLSDQDDIWMSDKIKVMVKALIDCDLVLCDCTIVDNRLKILAPSLFKQNKTQRGALNNFIKNGYIGCCMAFKKSILKKALPFPPNIPMHDQWIGLVAERHFRTKHIPDKLVQYRRHEDSHTSTGSKSKNSLISKLKCRYILFSRLMKFEI